ncbi:MAG TPA: PAS domain-containing protein [Cytophagaceae bacterium]|nr:PAS domain-containing protein [Cytophagaceae bacterium]
MLLKSLWKYSFVKRSLLTQLLEENTRYKAQIEESTNFIKDIENGKLDTSFRNENNSDNQLTMALVSMQMQLKKISEEEKNRNWATEGLARFADILRQNNEDLYKLGDSIISNLVKYMNANQGGIFVLNEDNPEETVLELIACYAYNRKKFLQKKVSIGEGLVGQTFLEKETIFMTELPQNYTAITSGLGDATPGCLVLVPLKVNETILGVIELAAFEAFPKYKIEFLEKIGESIASSLAAVRIAYRTEKLLRESQIQTEQLRSQEEEVRQNMEELSATQEEMHRILKEAQGKEQYLNELINVSNDNIFTIDKNFKLISFNKVFSSTLEAMGIPVTKGFDFMSLFPDEKEKQQQRALYQRAFNGERFEQTDMYERDGVTSYYLACYSPLYNEQGEIFAAAGFSKDVTAMITAQKQSEQLLAQSKQQQEEMMAQEEELRQNMEELSSTQEEMHRLLMETKEKEHYLDELINAPIDSIFTVDRDLKIISFNKALSTALEAMGVKLEKGFDFLQLFPDEESKNKQRAYYARAFKGERFEQVDQYGEGDQLMYYLASWSPLYDQDGNVFAVASFSKEVTNLVKAKEKVKV